MSEIFNDTKHRAGFLRQMSCFVSVTDNTVYAIVVNVMLTDRPVTHLEQVDRSCSVSHCRHGVRRVTSGIESSAAEKTKSVILPYFVS